MYDGHLLHAFTCSCDKKQNSLVYVCPRTLAKQTARDKKERATAGGRSARRTLLPLFLLRCPGMRHHCAANWTRRVVGTHVHTLLFHAIEVKDVGYPSPAVYVGVLNQPRVPVGVHPELEALLGVMIQRKWKVVPIVP